MRAVVYAALAAFIWGGTRVGRMWWRDRRRLRRIDGALREVRQAEAAGRLRAGTALILESELKSLRSQCPGGGGGR